MTPSVAAEDAFEPQLSNLKKLQTHVYDTPYSIVSRVEVAAAYKSLGYPDLAAGDAYKALLLVDELVEEGEYYEQVLSTTLSDLASGRVKLLAEDSDVEEGDKESKACLRAKDGLSKIAYNILISSLIECGCLRSAFDFVKRADRAFPNDAEFHTYQERITSTLRAHFEACGDVFSQVEVQEYPDKGMVRRELYPWNEHEPDRYSEETLRILNDEMSNVAPELEVRMVDLPLLDCGTPVHAKDEHHKTRSVKQLGVFAKEDIPPGREVLREKSILTGISRLHETYCDACSITLPKADHSFSGAPSEDAPRPCEDCGEVHFCSAECEMLAQTNYHPSLCGVDTEQKVAAKEAADSLYTLLLVRALALADTRDMHPLDMKELRFIWGDYHGVNLYEVHRAATADTANTSARSWDIIPKTLLFSFTNNILTPLHFLEKMDINIFEQSHRYDTWVLNTIYAKLRGTASAQQGLDGRPEIGAVHPMWCLANHSCAPNVAWQWQGSIRFQAREQLVDWAGRGADDRPGIRKGEEVLSHYCDVSLSVTERREWAIGALGGNCMCRRCTWEASHMA